MLEISNEWAREFSRKAELLLKTPAPIGSQLIDKTLNTVFPETGSMTDRQRRNRDNVITLVRAIYLNSNNAGGYGYNGWSLVNAIGEYLDHHRKASPQDRAVASMDTNSWVSRTKIKAQDYLLSL